MVEMGLVPAWMVMIVLARELAVTALRNVAAGRGILIEASVLGKGKMVTQVVAIFLLLLSRPFPMLRLPSLVVLWIVLVVTVVSGIDYFLRFWRDVLRSPVRPDAPKEFPGGSLEARTK